MTILTVLEVYGNNLNIKKNDKCFTLKNGILLGPNTINN